MKAFAPAARFCARVCLLGLLTACTITSKAPDPGAIHTLPPAPPPPVSPPPVPAAPPSAANLSTAASARDYRRDAAGHLYARYSDRIFKGKMPPLLFAIGVLQVDVSAQGQVTAINWMRAPYHQPQVVAEIERLVRQAAPYPVPIRLGKVTYTDTWLWDRSGKFQLDTLTEGQL